MFVCATYIKENFVGVNFHGHFGLFVVKRMVIHASRILRLAVILTLVGE